MLKIKCIEEPVRNSNKNMTSWKPPFHVVQGVNKVSTKSSSEPTPCALLRRQHLFAPALLGMEPIDELFSRLQQVIAGQATLPEQTSALLTFWTIGSWFADSLSARLAAVP